MNKGLETMQNVNNAKDQELLGRMGKASAEALIALYEKPHLEREKRQFPFFLKVDYAHVAMLAEEGIIHKSQASQIFNALVKLEQMGVNALDLDAKHGSMLFQIERFLFSEVGEDIGGRVHIGRSRLDQGPTVRRLYKRGMLISLMSGINTLRSALIERAATQKETLMPGYTCLQHAHPTVFGQYLLSFASKLADDFQRLAQTYERLNLNPLGGAGLSGTSWPINRDRTTELLGFDGLVKNSKLVREAYYAAELANGLAMLMSTLNDLATDLHIWSSYEFGFVELSDEFCGTSSIFPQKKNPVALEAVKFLAGEAISWPSIILTTFRSEGTGDVVMREAPLLDHAFSSSLMAVELMSPVVTTLNINASRMKKMASANWSTATVLADNLVRDRELSFRNAHTMVGRFVRLSLERGFTVDDVSGALLDEAAEDLGMTLPKFSDETVKSAFDADAFMRSRVSSGSINPKEVDVLHHDAIVELHSSQSWLNTTHSNLQVADEKLRGAVESISSNLESST